ncbi:MAG: dodecin [Myxococcota bacterium]
MGDHVYKKIQVVGSATESLDRAIRNAIETAGETVQNMRWFEVDEIRGHIEGNQVAHYQVSLQIGFTIERSKD